MGGGGEVWARELKLPESWRLGTQPARTEGWKVGTVCRNYEGEGYFACFSLGVSNVGGGRGRAASLFFWWLLNL